MEDYNLIKIKPCDNTFFGDGNQFNFNISNVIKSKNTPFPSVFYGAIFSALLANDDSFMEEFLKCKNNAVELARLQKATLEIEQVYLYNEKYNDVYIKAPLDVFVSENGREKVGEFNKKRTEECSLKYDYIIQAPNENRKYERANKHYINIRTIFIRYKNKLSSMSGLIHEEKIFKNNIKVGIAIDNKTNTIKEGMLYRIEQTEFVSNDWSYLVQYKLKSEVKELSKGFLKLGGENKVCKYESVNVGYINDHIEKEFVKERNKNKTKQIKGKIKIVATMDSYFEESLSKTLKDSGLKILGLSNDKPINLGGYDMVSKNGKGAIRTMYKGYSAGTVILAEPNSEKLITYNDIYVTMQNKNIKGFNKVIIFEEEFK